MGSVDGAAHDREPCVRPCLRDHAGGRAGGTTSCPGPPDGRGYGARHARAARGRHGMNATRSAWPDPAAPIVPDWMEHRGTLLSAEDEWREITRLLPLIDPAQRSEEHTSELQSLMRISYAVFCL